MSSYGHIRDLKKREMSIDTNTLEPEYEIPSEKEKLVKELKSSAENAEKVWLASDEDREGEAISWHLCEVLGLDEKKTSRIVFHEITKPAILQAIEHPRDIDEKIQWLKFYGDTSQWPRLADKYAVREYVKEKGLEDILVPLIGKWDKAEDIPWDALPNQFVMKTNHGSGDALVCTDKSQLDTAYHTKNFDRLLKEKFGVTMYEPHYDKIKPCIIAEELLDSSRQDYPSSSPIDYKMITTPLQKNALAILLLF